MDSQSALVQQIAYLKKEKNAVILVHSYQRPEVQDIGDYVGDSLGLCIEASKTDADRIIFCGVHFMAESAKILNPDKTVVLPDANAGCPMANMADAEGLGKLKSENPGVLVVCYVNSTAEVKAESDICCTSSNAVAVVNSLPKDKRVIFVPDKYLGGYVCEQTGRDMILWPGYCPTHQKILPEYIMEKKRAYPRAVVLAHPECSKETIQLADVVGSTGYMFSYCSESEKQQFIIATENGLLYRLKKFNPGKEFIPASDLAVCPNMKLTTLRSVCRALDRMEPEIDLDPELIRKSYDPIARMLEVTA